MGFRIGILFVSTRESGFFGTNPKLIESRIPRVCGMLGISKARRIESFDNMVHTFNPRDKQFALGVYHGAFYYSAGEILNGNLLEIYESKKSKILQDYPDAEALVIQVHDTVNLFGYALYRGANLVRAYGGNGDDDVTVERGELQPEEKPFFSKSWVVFGKRYFLDSSFPVPFNTPAFGSQLAYTMASRFTGGDLIRQGGFHLPVNLFEGAG